MISLIPFETHEEWLCIRSRYIGGSDAGAVVGLDDYKSPYALYAEKVGAVKPFEGNTITEVGSFLEEYVAKRFTAETGKKVRRSSFTYVNDKYPWACANVDRLVVGEDAILEIKTSGNYKYARQIREGEPVPKWWAQMVHYMAVLEKKKAYLAVLLDCREFFVLEFDFDPDEAAALMSAEEAFWGMVQSKTPPQPDGLPSTNEAISAMFPTESNIADIDLSADNNVLLQYTALSKQIKALEVLRDSAANQIKQRLGAATTGACDGFRVSWKAQSRRTFDHKRFSQEHPEMDLSGYFKESISRVFRLTERE